MIELRWGEKLIAVEETDKFLNAFPVPLLVEYFNEMDFACRDPVVRRYVLVVDARNNKAYGIVVEDDLFPWSTPIIYVFPQPRGRFSLTRHDWKRELIKAICTIYARSPRLKRFLEENLDTIGKEMIIECKYLKRHIMYRFTVGRNSIKVKVRGE